MRGHIRKRGRKWTIVVELDRDPLTRKRRQRWYSGYGTRKDAERALPAILRTLQTGEWVAPTKLTFADFIEGTWLPAVRHRQTRVTTVESYEMNLRVHVTPLLGSVALQSLAAGHLNALYQDLLVSGRKDGEGGLSVRTVRYVHAIVRHALKDATRWGLVARNVAEMADPPAPSKPPEPSTWSPSETRTFLHHVAGDPLSIVWTLYIETGMRRGEVLGLRWTDLDLEQSSISVRRTLVSVRGGVQESEPKTSYGTRTLTLDPATVASLRAHRADQARHRLELGAAYQDEGRVFARHDGSPIRPEYVTRRFRQLAEEAGLPRIRLHDLRHGWGTQANRHGVDPVTIQRQLGHHSAAFTMATYVHAVPEAQRQAALKVAGLFR